MKTIFCDFLTYADADRAIGELVEQDFELGEMNALIPANSSRSQSTEGFLVGGETRLEVPDAGTVYVFGALATQLTRTSGPAGDRESLQEALVDFEVPDDKAQHYVRVVRQGGVLFFIRTTDEEAERAVNILHAHQAGEITSYAPRSTV